MIKTIKKGFTLVELLIVIAILAVLAAAVIVVLNPGELLAQARDSQRVSDLASVQQALAVYISQVEAASFGSCPAGGRCTVSLAAGVLGPFGGGAQTYCAGGSAVLASTAYAGRTVDGNGWVDVILSGVTGIPGGSPISTLPIDPTNSTNYYYGYACSNSSKTFELSARLESIKYRPRMGNDGGNRSTCTDPLAVTCFYETGTSLTL